MKIKGNMVLSKVSDTYVAVPVGETVNEFNGLIRLNETGKTIWDGIEAGLDAEQIADRVVELYEGTDHDTALEDTKKIIEKFRAEGLLEE